MKTTNISICCRISSSGLVCHAIRPHHDSERCLPPCGSRRWVRSARKTRTMQAPPQRPPLALRAIALVEAAKGVRARRRLRIISLRHTDLYAATDAFLLRHGINPERHYTRLFIESVSKATNHHVGEIAALGLAYALMRLAEGYGLWQGKHWAEWVAVISAGILPATGISALRPPRNVLYAGVGSLTSCSSVFDEPFDPAAV